MVIKSMRMRWAGNAARMGDMRNVFKVLVGKPEGKRPFVRNRRRRNIRMDLTVGWSGLDSSGSGWGSYEHSNEISGGGDD